MLKSSNLKKKIGNWNPFGKLRTRLEIGNSPLSGAGFTLIEVVIVMALIAVLGTWMIMLINPPQQFKKGRDATRKSDLRQLQAAFELHRADLGVYPATPLPDCGTPLAVDTVTYIQKIPCDPSTSEPYSLESDGETYSLITCLENLSDIQKDTENRPDTSGGTYCNGTTSWSYTLINP